MGSHAFGFNHLSIGLCLIGGREEDRDFPSDNFTDMQRAALLKYASGFLVEYPGTQIAGHSEVMKWRKRNSPSKTAHSCPALDVQAIRDTAAKLATVETRTLTQMVTGHKIRSHALSAEGETYSYARQATTETKPD